MIAIVFLAIVIAVAVLAARFGADSRPRYHDRQDWQRRS
jgi:hypothetical protein